MARGLVVNGPAEGHINPTLGIVEELVRRGDDIVYFTAEEFRGRIEPTGAVVRTYDGDRFRERMRPFFAPGQRHLLEKARYLLESADVVVDSIREQTKDEHFDYLIHDANLGGGRTVADVLHLPSIASCTTFASTQAFFDTGLKQMSRFISKDENERLHKEFLHEATKFRRKHGVHIKSAYEVFCNPAQMTLVYTTQEFQPHGDAFDGSFKFVGPSISSRQTGDEIDWSKLSNTKVIYVSLGTIVNQMTSFYELCFEALESLDLHVVLSVGTEYIMRQLTNVPENFTVRPYVAQLDVLQHAALFVTHGGMNSVSEGLRFGVPLVVIPQNADQFMVSQRVVDMGAGVQLSMNDLSSDRLRDGVLQLLRDGSFKRCAETLGESFREAGGCTRAVEEISIFKRQHGIDP